MKKFQLKWAVPFLFVAAVACNDEADTAGTDGDTASTTTEMTSTSSETAHAGYVDLNTGQPVEIWYDTDKKTTFTRDNTPVEFYVNTSTGDTVYGRGRFVVNNLLVRSSDGKYKLDETKIKRDGDEWKLKSDDTKIKIEAGELKMKTDTSKTKADDDGTKKKPDGQ